MTKSMFTGPVGLIRVRKARLIETVHGSCRAKSVQAKMHQRLSNPPNTQHGEHEVIGCKFIERESEGIPQRLVTT